MFCHAELSNVKKKKTMTLRVDVEKVLRRLEGNAILLSGYGNHNGEGTCSKRMVYYEEKDAGLLFRDLESIDRIRRNIKDTLQKHTKWCDDNSYGLKHYLEGWRKTNDHDPVKGDYLCNGDFIMAMILEGYEYKFREKVNSSITMPSGVNCRFKCRERK